MSRTVVILLAVANAIAGCIAVAPSATPHATVSPEHRPATSGGGSAGGPGDQPTHQPAAETGDSPFNRKDVPSGGVAEFLEFRPGGGDAGLCPGDHDLITEEDRRPFYFTEAGIPEGVCVSGLLPGAPVSFLMRAPGGREWTAETGADPWGFAGWDFEKVPGRIEGRYFIRATQAGRAPLEREFRVRITRLSAAVVPAGITIGQATELVIAGGEPATSVPAHLYRFETTDDGQRWSYATKLGDVVMDRRGWGRTSLRARRGDPVGAYLVIVDPSGANIELSLGIGEPSVVEGQPAVTDEPTIGEEESAAPGGDSESPSIDDVSPDTADSPAIASPSP